MASLAAGKPKMKEREAKQFFKNEFSKEEKQAVIKKEGMAKWMRLTYKKKVQIMLAYRESQNAPEAQPAPEPQPIPEPQPAPEAAAGESKNPVENIPDPYPNVSVKEPTQYCIVGLRNGNIQVWDALRGELCSEEAGHATWVTAIAFKEINREFEEAYTEAEFYTACMDGTMIRWGYKYEYRHLQSFGRWGPSNGRVIPDDVEDIYEEYLCQPEAILDIDYLGKRKWQDDRLEEKTALVAYGDGSVGFRNMQRDDERLSLSERHDGCAAAVSYCDEDFLVSGGYDGRVFFYLNEELYSSTLPHPDGHLVQCLAWCGVQRFEGREGGYIAVTGGTDSKCVVLDLTAEHSNIIAKYEMHTGAVQAVIYCGIINDRHIIASADEEGVVCVWDLRTGEVLHRCEDAVEVGALRLTYLGELADKLLLCVLTLEGGVLVYDMNSMELLHTLPTGPCWSLGKFSRCRRST